MFVSLPFDGQKQDRIGQVMALLAIILSIAAYKPAWRNRLFAYGGSVLGVAAFLLYVFCPSL